MDGISVTHPPILENWQGLFLSYAVAKIIVCIDRFPILSTELFYSIEQNGCIMLVNWN